MHAEIVLLSVTYLTFLYGYIVHNHVMITWEKPHHLLLSVYMKGVTLMSQDPNSNYSSDPQNPYDADSQNPYNSSPFNPYQPYNPSPTDPYSAGLSGAPAPQPPYPPMPYPTPNLPGYGYPPPNQGFGYNPPPTASPLPLGQAIRELPQQYWRVLTKPSAQTFTQEIGKAEWGIVWVEIIGYAILGAILYALTIRLNPAFNNLSTIPTTPNNTINPTVMQGFLLGFSYSMVIWIPIGLFISVGIYYLIAQAFKGQGTFLQQMYGTLLIALPVGLLSLLLDIIPLLGSLAVSGLSIYAIVLNIFMLMGVHKFSGGRATLVYFIPIIVAVLLICIFSTIIIGLIVAAVRSSHP